MSTVTINQTTRSPYPKHPYEQIKKDILGATYELSLNFIGTKRAQQLNQNYRQKTYIPNVLSFPLTSTCGEVYISPAVAKTQAKKYNLTVRGYIGFLFIHACLHLKGLPHGDTMERAEKRYIEKYQLR